jgi:hypothetical protein
MRHGADGFTSPPQEGVMPIYITFKNSLPSAGIEPAKPGSNGKHAVNYTTEHNSKHP